MSDEERALVSVTTVQPLVTPEQAARANRVFLELVKQLLVPDDYQNIAGKQCIKKSGFRRIALCFNLSDRILEQERIEREDGSFYWRIVVEVEAPNGRVCSGVGICDSKERSFAHVEHDVYATCHTRAKNRSISDMVAGGITSAEELDSAPAPKAKAKTKAKKKRDGILDTVILKKQWNWNKIFEEFGPHIEKRHKELGEKEFSFEYAAVVVAQEEGCTKKQELPL